VKALLSRPVNRELSVRLLGNWHQPDTVGEFQIQQLQ